MSFKRLLLPLLALLLLLSAYLAYVHWTWTWSDIIEWWELRKDPPLPGENRLGKLVLKQKDDSTWTASFEYYYTGKPRFVHIGLTSLDTVGNVPKTGVQAHGAQQAVRGLHTVAWEIHHPGSLQVSAVTRSITVALTGYVAPTRPEILAQVTAPQPIEWFDRATIENRPDNVLARSIDLIDSGQLREAKGALDALVAREPKFDPAYVELARIAMKTNPNPEGLRNGEALIQTALQIRPDSVNAKILLAYVYQHQQRYAEADALNHEVAQAGTTNLWHWANWGEWYQLQGRTDEAIAKYREGLARPRTKDASDRARPWIYWNVLDLVQARSDWDAADALYRARMQDYPMIDCYALGYGDFLLHQRGDAAAALQALRKVKEARCEHYSAADLRGAALYLLWAKGPEAQRAESLRQARVFLPSGPAMLYQLARSEATAPVARQLVAAGEQIGAQNSEKLDALAIALGSRDLPAARRLLKLGARTDSLVGEEKMPVALIPVLMRDLDAVQMLQRAGVDYARLRYRGVTAPEVARRNGDTELLRVLEPKASALTS
jgi:tetratricopeptide (TPR) repeat protein